MDEEKNKDELEAQLEQATQQAQNEGSDGVNTNQAGDNHIEDNHNPADGQNINNKKQGNQNQNGNGQGISPDLGTAKEQMKEDGIEIL